MNSQSVKEKKKVHIGKGLRYQILAWAMVLGVVGLIGATVAWYSLMDREAETETANVVKPYHLKLLNASQTDVLQLSIGSLPQGKTKQIVFCVSNENEQLNKDKSVFEYELELVHTDNLALKYEIYHLEDADAGDSGVIVAEDIIIAENGATSTYTTYWKKTGTALAGTNVSDERHEQVGLEKTEINKGTYISYGKVTDEDGTVLVDNDLQMDAEEKAYATQYFVLEISWDISSNFEKYDRETDMIYILAKVLQPEPEKSTP